MGLETKSIEACIQWAQDAADEEFKHPRAARAELAALITERNGLAKKLTNAEQSAYRNIKRAERAEADVARLSAEVAEWKAKYGALCHDYQATCNEFHAKREKMKANHEADTAEIARLRAEVERLTAESATRLQELEYLHSASTKTVQKLSAELEKTRPVSKDCCNCKGAGCAPWDYPCSACRDKSMWNKKPKKEGV